MINRFHDSSDSSWFRVLGAGSIAFGAFFSGSTITHFSYGSTPRF